jgi:hypothetical protein
MAKKDDPQINPALVSFVDKLLEQTLKDPNATLDQKNSVIDRAIKIEQLKLKLPNNGFGAGLFDDD